MAELFECTLSYGGYRQKITAENTSEAEMISREDVEERAGRAKDDAWAAQDFLRDVNVHVECQPKDGDIKRAQNYDDYEDEVRRDSLGY